MTTKNSKDKPIHTRPGYPSGLPIMSEEVEGEREVFDIFPGYPEERISSKLRPNIPNMCEDEGGTTVHVFTVPANHSLVINPSDITQEALFEAYDANHKFINGLITINAEFAFGNTKRVYSATSAFHNPENEVSSMGMRRRWQFGVTLKPGDKLRTKFFAKEAIDINQTHLDHRVNIIKHDMSKLKIKKQDTELYMIYPESPNEECSSKLSVNNGQYLSAVYTFHPPTGHTVCIYSEDERCGVDFDAKNKAGKIIPGEVEVYVRKGLAGFRERLYMGVSGETNSKNKRWFKDFRVYPSDCIEVSFFSKYKLDPNSSRLGLRVRVYKTTP